MHQITTKPISAEHVLGHQRQRVDRVGIAGVSVIQANRIEIENLRLNPGTAPIAEASILRHSECQTVLGVAAVLKVIEANPVLGPFDHWGTIVSPCRPGRAETTTQIEKFHKVGVRGIGPHTIPTLSLHAGAATLSIILGAHGPVFGVSGGPAHVEDGLLAGLTSQLARNNSGTWLVFTDWGGDAGSGFGLAVAMALVPFTDRIRDWSLSYCPGVQTRERPPAGLNGLAEFLRRCGSSRWDCPLACGGQFSLCRGGLA